jgi:hypothetical protein
LLLRGVATGDLDGTSLSDREARALVAVAADAPAEKIHADTGDRRRREAKSTILALLQVAELEADDLDEIDRVVHERQRELATQRRSTADVPDSTASSARRLGTGTIEAKMISNGHSVRLFGPYLYFWPLPAASRRRERTAKSK